MSLLLTLEEAAAGGGGGSALLVNGDFATGDLTGWTESSPGAWRYWFSIGEHTAHYLDAVDNAVLLNDGPVWENGATYRLEYRVNKTASSPRIQLDAGSTALGIFISNNIAGNYFKDFTLGAGPYTNGLGLRGQTVGRYCYLTNLVLTKTS